jgi:hypothetical protein
LGQGSRPIQQAGDLDCSADAIPRPRDSVPASGNSFVIFPYGRVNGAQTRSGQFAECSNDFCQFGSCPLIHGNAPAKIWREHRAAHIGFADRLSLSRWSLMVVHQRWGTLTHLRAGGWIDLRDLGEVLAHEGEHEAPVTQ